MTLDSPRRQAVGNNEGDIIVIAMRGQRRIGYRIQAAAEIGPHQISLPIRGGAGEGNDRYAEPGQVRRQFRFIKRRMHGVAGAGMRKLKVQHFTGRERRAGATQADARRGETAQIFPQVVIPYVVLRHYDFCLRTIFSENRLSLFGIMREQRSKTLR